MIYNEQKGNLFDLDDKYALAHCISYDTDNLISWSKGIVVDFRRKFKGLKEYVHKVVIENNLSYPCVVPYIDYYNKRIVFNLITKEYYFSKPTYKSMTKCIKDMVYLCRKLDIKYLGLPKIGCGLDKLSWSKVREIIKEEFKDLDIEIEVRYL